MKRIKSQFLPLHRLSKNNKMNRTYRIRFHLHMDGSFYNSPFKKPYRSTSCQPDAQIKRLISKHALSLFSQKLSQNAVRHRFFTRRSGRTETCGDLLPSPDKRGPDIRQPTRNPFVKMWVKAITEAHIPGYISLWYKEHYSGLRPVCQ